MSVIKEVKILWENTENAVTVSCADYLRSLVCVKNAMIKTVLTGIVELVVVRKRRKITAIQSN